MDGRQSSNPIREADIPLIDHPVPASPLSISRVLTIGEIACELRCSKAHVHHLISGKIAGLRPLPSLWLGRRRLILRASFEEWLRNSEQNHV
jgi:hypothetical protein